METPGTITSRIISNSFGSDFPASGIHKHNKHTRKKLNFKYRVVRGNYHLAIVSVYGSR